MNSLLITITFFLYIHTEIIYSSNRELFSCKIRELNYQDPYEIQQACKLFQDKDTQSKTGNISFDDMEYDIHHKNKSSRFIIFELNAIEKQKSRIIGLLHLKIHKAHKAVKYQTIAVDKNYRKLGVASSLMNTAQQEFIPASTEIIHLSVQHQNQDAIRCYQNNGFTIHQETQLIADCCIPLWNIIPCLNASQISYGMIKTINRT